VDEEYAVADLVNKHAIKRAQDLDQPISMRCVDRLARDVDPQPLWLGFGDVQSGDHATGGLDSMGEVAHRRPVRRGLEAHSDRIGDARR
jgi:hypothetical protein